MLFKNLLPARLTWKGVVSIITPLFFFGSTLIPSQSFATHESNVGRLVIMFDDGNDEVLVEAVPYMESKGLRGTFCIHTDKIDTLEHFTPDEIDIVLDNHGHEVCAHSQSHPYLTTLSNAEIQEEVVGSKQILQAIIGRTVVSFATPYGDVDSRVRQIIRNAGFKYSRDTDDSQMNSTTTPKHALFSYSVINTTSISKLTNMVRQAKAQKKLLIIVFHRINKPGQYSYSIIKFKQFINMVKAEGIKVSTLRAAGSTYLTHN